MGREEGARKGRSLAIVFVLIIGLVSLLADIANEGTRSIIGPYLVLLGASATTVAVVAGLSELTGYSLRILFGWVTDKKGHYWAFLFVGYTINVVAVPALALAGDWVGAVCLIMAERVGRAIRSPARDAMLSHAGKEVGRGWSYGVQEALSSVGGMVGPMVVVIVMLLDGDYRLGFEVLLVPALLAMVFLAYARKINPDPRKMEGSCFPAEKKKRFSRRFWIYVLAGAFIACGYADFPLIAFHIGTLAGVSEGWIPVLYAVAMASDALSALAFGKLYDRRGMMSLVAASLVVPLFVPLIFSSDFAVVVIGMLLYGVGFGAQESVMRAIVADLSPHCRRGFAFGSYNAAFGVAWFLGSVSMGILYDISLPVMMALSMGLQFAAVPLLAIVMRRHPKPLPEKDREEAVQASGTTTPSALATLSVLTSLPVVSPEKEITPSPTLGTAANTGTTAEMAEIKE
ncbi:MAG: MFS transporter [Candidatus Saccharibacteria bacterium]